MKSNIKRNKTVNVSRVFAALLMVLLPSLVAAQNYTRIGFGAAGIKLNRTVYTINAINTGNNANTQRGSISSNSTSLVRTTSPNASDVNEQFVFITGADNDTTEVYLYSVAQKKFARVAGTGRDISLTNGFGSLIYVYPTNDTQFNHAFAFSPDVNFSTSSNTGGSNVINISGGKLQTLNYSQLDNGNRWRVDQVTGATFTEADLAEARRQLNHMSTAFHYKGVHGRNLRKGMQDVDEVNYYYYVNYDTDYGYGTTGNFAHAMDLNLPLYNYNGFPDPISTSGRNGNNMEPYGYFRWYDYRTDSIPAADRVVRWTYQANHAGNQQLNRIYDNQNVDRGWVGYNMQWQNSGPSVWSVGVLYKVPQDANNADWNGDVIACDVSRYTDYSVQLDGNGNGIYPENGDGFGTVQTGSGGGARFTEKNADNYPFLHEPTLSTRYIYHILPAKRIARQLKDGLLLTGRGHDRTAGDKGILIFGAFSNSSTMNLRTDLTDLKYYWFYPVNNFNNRHVYYPAEDEDSFAIKESDIDSSQVVQAKSVEWRVYNPKMTRYRIFHSGTDRSFSFSVNNLTSGTIYDLSGNPVNDMDDSPITNPGTCYLVGILVNGNNKCPFFNAELQLNTSNYPMSDAQIESENRTERTISYLSTNYGSPVAMFSFDNENSNQNLTPLADYTDNFSMPDANMASVPSNFRWRQFGFLYPQMGNYAYIHNGYISKTIPLHGDFGLYKSFYAYKKIYDRTYITSNGAQEGYFMYTDASNESRMLGYQDFEGNLCPGSQIIISAYVCNMTDNTEKPELRFELQGVDKDMEGNDRRTKLFASLCSGKFDTNIKDWGRHGDRSSRGEWYQVYGVVTLPMESGIDNFSNYRVVIDNFCNNTSGADYAIDDIRVYQSNSRLSVVQIPVMCEDGENANQVAIKIKANYSVAHQLSGPSSGDKKVYYRFVRAADGTPVTGTDFYGEGHSNYGEAIVPQNYSATAHLNNNPADSLQFETGRNGNIELVLANRHFQLGADTTYYVSVAVENPDTAGVPGAWGVPSNICSFYSTNFQLVKQHLYIRGTQSNSTQVTVQCGDASSSRYPAVRVSITAPDQVNGGTTTLNGIPFSWFRGTRTHLNELTLIEGNDTSTLLGAIRHYNAAYPGVAFDSTKTAPNGDYTALDRKIIIKYHYYADSNPNGILLMSYTDSLSALPVTVGRNTYLAIPAVDHITIGGVSYELCNDPMALMINGLQNGPGLDLGIPGIPYPSSQQYRSLRIGLPQINRIGSTGKLSIPIRNRYYQGVVNNDEDLQFFNGDTQSKEIFVSETNDPAFDMNNAKIAEVVHDTLLHSDGTLDLWKIDASKLHEGYQYEISFQFKRSDAAATGVQCSGETYLILKIVPEYLTWNPTADQSLNSNWNNDANWTRSTAGELYDATYRDYRKATYRFTLHDANGVSQGTRWNVNVDDNERLKATSQPASYVPMYFSKVIIPMLSSQPYPMLGFIRRQSGTNLVLNMTNDKNHSATANIEYDMEAGPAGTDDSDNYVCRVFDGNLCEQVYFKTTAQLRNEQFLNYQRAWVELALPVNIWGTFTTPMKQSVSGDMYVPKVTAQQTTPLFKDITFDDVDAVDQNGKPWTEGAGTKFGLFGKANDRLYSRIRMPIYQKLWGTGGNEYSDTVITRYTTSYDNPYTMLIYPAAENGDNMDFQDGETWNSNRNAWSHTFNALGKTRGRYDLGRYGRYGNGEGVAGKIGDDYATPTETGSKWNGQYAIIRLPKADRKFRFYKLENGREVADTATVTVDRTDNYRLGIDYSNDENNIGEQRVTTASLSPEPSLAWTFNADSTDIVYSYDKDGNVMYATQTGEPTTTPNGIVYELVGNPYTSTISVKSFVEANQSILRTVKRVDPETKDSVNVYRVWVLRNSVLYELNPELSSSVISPGESFFIKVQVPGRDEVEFTTLMQTDPAISVYSKALTLEDEEAAKAYRITDEEDIADVIENGRITREFRCWSPKNGYIVIDRGGYEGSWSAQVYTIDGQQVTSINNVTDESRQVAVGSGLFIVHIVKPGAQPESFKVVVR